MERIGNGERSKMDGKLNDGETYKERCLQQEKSFSETMFLYVIKEEETVQ